MGWMRAPAATPLPASIRGGGGTERRNYTGRQSRIARPTEASATRLLHTTRRSRTATAWSTHGTGCWDMTQRHVRRWIAASERRSANRVREGERRSAKRIRESERRSSDRIELGRERKRKSWIRGLAVSCGERALREEASAVYFPIRDTARPTLRGRTAAGRGGACPAISKLRQQRSSNQDASERESCRCVERQQEGAERAQRF